MSEYPSYLIHYGIEGQKWGVRRFQNEDGTYTEDGLVRRRKDQRHLVNKQNKIGKQFDKYTEKMKSDKAAGKKISDRRINKAIKLGTKHRALDYISKDPETYFKARNLRAKSIAKFGVNSALTAVGVGKVIDEIGMKNVNEQAIERIQKELPGQIYRLQKTQPITSHLDKVKEYFKDGTKIENTQSSINTLPENVKWFVNKHRQELFNPQTGEFKIDRLNRAVDMAIEQEKRNHQIFINNATREDMALANENIAKYTKSLNEHTRNLNIAGVFTAVNLARSVAELSVEQYKINKMVKNHYKDSYALAEQATIKDLKKHGFNKEINAAKESRIKSLLSSGKSQAEVADILGLSESTIRKYK